MCVGHNLLYILIVPIVIYSPVCIYGSDIANSELYVLVSLWCGHHNHNLKMQHEYLYEFVNSLEIHVNGQY